MALNPEDKKDVKNAYGKAIANKVEKVTRDKGRTGTWVDDLDKSKYSPSQLKRWTEDSKRAKAQMEKRMDMRKRGIPTGPRTPSNSYGN